MFCGRLDVSVDAGVVGARGGLGLVVAVMIVLVVELAGLLWAGELLL